MKTKTEVAPKKKKKKKELHKNLLFLYYNFSLGRGLGLLDCSLQGPLVCSCRVAFSRNWKTCKNNLHPRGLILFNGVLGNGRGLGGISGHSLCHLSLFSIRPKLLGHLWRATRGGGTWLMLLFLRSVTLGKVFALELLEEEARMA